MKNTTLDYMIKSKKVELTVLDAKKAQYHEELINILNNSNILAQEYLYLTHNKVEDFSLFNTTDVAELKEKLIKELVSLIYVKLLTIPLYSFNKYIFEKNESLTAFDEDMAEELAAIPENKTYLDIAKTCDWNNFEKETKKLIHILSQQKMTILTGNKDKLLSNDELESIIFNYVESSDLLGLIIFRLKVYNEN